MSEFHGKPRLHKAYITVSGSGPEKGTVHSGVRGVRRSRDGADLRFTTADCDWFYEHLRQPNYDTGLAEEHYRLVNPTREELDRAIASAGQFLSQYIHQPEWAGGQMTFVYAGHGSPDTGAWVLKDGVADGIELSEKVAASLQPNARRCRIDLILDSCFAGAFFADFLSHNWTSLDERIFVCDAFGAALDNEFAWELDEYEHGAFTYAFKNMFEPMVTGEPSLPRHKQTRIRDIDRLRSGGVSWLTADEQHAFEYINGHLEVIGGGHINFHQVELLSSNQIRYGMADALNEMPNVEVMVRE
ncbi:MAG: hypothetical protein WKF74_07295 [Pyrinomonadaceae bacterium]